MNALDCRRAQELFSDHADGSLNGVLAAELEAHLGSCADCRGLRDALGEVVAALRSHPALEPGAGLAERVAVAALVRRRGGERPAAAGPRLWRPLRLAAAVALLASGSALLASGPESGAARSADRLADRVGNGLAYLAERKDRALEDVRILRVVIAAAFAGRLDQVNDRFDDYRRLLERRQAAVRPGQSSNDVDKQSNSARADLVTRLQKEKEPART